MWDQITVIPEAIGKLTNLTGLWLRNNQITVIPEAIGKLTNLTELSFHENQITVIPEAIGKLTNLTKLSFRENQITVILEAIGKLTNLTELDLSNNQITDIPQWFQSFKNLEKLDLSGNPVPIPPEILRGDLAAILEFYFQIDPQPTVNKGVTRNGDASALYPIWYGTNRKLVDRDGISQWFGGARNSQIHYGCCQVAVPKSHKIGSTGSNWWKRLSQGSDDRLTLDRASLQLLDEINFFGSIKSALQDRPLDERSALVFIHGFNVSFESAALQAAQIGFDLQVPGITIFYSWPSLGKLTGYAADEATIGGSEKYITEFLVNLAENGGIDKIHIMAHSMGNRGLLGAMQRILAQVDATNPSISFGQIFLAAPDIDPNTFQDLAVACQHLAERTTLYVSSKDKALKASSFIHKSSRVGFFPPVMTYEGIDTVVVSDIDLTLLGHDYDSDEMEVLTDMHQLLMSNTPPKQRFGLRSVSSSEGNYWHLGK